MLILGIGGLVEARFNTDDSFDYIRYVRHLTRHWCSMFLFGIIMH